MSNVSRINQDDVLGVEDLSPGEFSHREEDENDAAALTKKKKSTFLPMITGIFIALGILGFFGWKIVSPYFSARGEVARERIEPIATTVPSTPQFSPDMSSPMPTTMPSSGTSDARLTPPGIPPAQQPQPTTQAQAVALAGEASRPSVSSTVQPEAVMPAKAIVGQTTTAANGSTPQALHAGADEISQVNRRIDSLGAAMASLKDVVDKLQADMQKIRVAATQKPVQISAAASKPVPHKLATPNVVVKKPVEATVKKTAESAKADVLEAGKPTSEIKLQAVLQDRAWFKTKAGETITVSPGEELTGVGVVTQIDADSGRVTFSNGLVYR